MKTLGLFFFFMLWQIDNIAQVVLVKKWDKRFGGGTYDDISVLQQTSDGGYILGGSSTSDIYGDKTQPNWDPTLQTYDFWVIKIDSLGNKQWDRRFGGGGDEFLTSILQTADSGYLLGGWSGSGMDGDKTQPSWGVFDNWIVKIDAIGNKQWDKRYGGFNNDLLGTVTITKDGGYLLGSESYSPISGDKTQDDWDTTYNWADYWLVKVDSRGNKEWDKRFGGVSSEEMSAVISTDDGGYIIGGSSASPVSGDKTQPDWDTIWHTTDYWVVKIDSLGNKIWDKRFGGTNDDNLNALLITSDGGYLLGGNSASGVSGDKTQPNVDTSGPAIQYVDDYWIVKIDSAGNKEWDKRYGGFDEDILYSLQITQDNGYLLAGNSRSNAGGDKVENNLGHEQTWIVKTDSLGNKQWDKTMFTLESHFGYAIQTKDGCYAIANTTGGGIAGYKTQTNWSDSAGNYWMIVFCDSVSTGINELTSEVQLNVFPNPFSKELDITIKQQSLNQARFSITNALGKAVYTKTETNLNNAYTKMLDLSYLPNGVYFVEVVVDGVCTTKEIVKQ